MNKKTEKTREKRMKNKSEWKKKKSDRNVII